jgi:hypothetical protein
VYELLGPKAKEIAVTIAETIEARGEVMGCAKTLIELLRAKFTWVPAEVIDSVNNADIVQLRAWTVRVLTAETLEGVFS